jgi:hypothetical protein
VADSVGLLTFSAVYLPQRNTVKQEQFEDVYNTLGQRFIAGGDYNAKYTDWRSKTYFIQRSRTTEGDGKRRLEKVMGEPTYWQSDRNKLPDVVEFCVTKGTLQDFAVAKSCFDLSSDHFPILITLTEDAMNQEKDSVNQLSSRHTNWVNFRRLVNERLTLNIPLKPGEDVKAAAKLFNDTTKCAGCNAPTEHKRTPKGYNWPIIIK